MKASLYQTNKVKVMSFQVLVATMQQNDFSIADKMNIHCGSVIANQAEREEITNQVFETYEHKMITTSTRGVGLNRNIALLAATADIVLFADDDVTYSDDMPQRVVDAFAEIPKADVIVFGMDMQRDGKIFEKRRCKKKRIRIWNSMRYGTYRIAARREALIENNITFHQCFGGGCEFGSGEDSLFLKKCFDSGLKIYSHDYVLGSCSKDKSSWFTGCNEKYFYDKGVLLRHLFPSTAYLMAFYFSFRFKRETIIKPFKRFCLMCFGVRYGKKMIPYRN